MLEMLRLCEAENGTNITELLQARASGHQGSWQDVKTNGKRLEDERKVKEDHQERIQKAVK